MVYAPDPFYRLDPPLSDAPFSLVCEFFARCCDLKAEETEQIVRDKMAQIEAAQGKPVWFDSALQDRRVVALISLSAMNDRREAERWRERALTTPTQCATTD